VAVLGFATGGLLALQEPARSVLGFFDRFAISSASIPRLLGVDLAWAIAGGLALIAFLIWISPAPERSPTAWPWATTGLALGLLGTLVWVAGTPSGWNWGISVTGPTRNLFGSLLGLHAPGWGAFLVLGIPLGSFASAVATGGFRWQAPPLTAFPGRFVGGLMMGFGGTLAGGCNIGNSLTAVSVLSLNGVIATLAILLGLAVGSRISSR
jgi:uncharacterized membrane protein YedE/YeeE